MACSAREPYLVLDMETNLSKEPLENADLRTSFLHVVAKTTDHRATAPINTLEQWMTPCQTSNAGIEKQIHAPQALLLQIQRQRQQLQGTLPRRSVTPPAPEHAPPNPANHSMNLKPAYPTRYSGVKYYNTIKNRIVSFNSEFTLTNANPMHIILSPTSLTRLQSGFDNNAENTKTQRSWEKVRTARRCFFTPLNKDHRLHDR